MGKSLEEMKADKERAQERWESHSAECEKCGKYVAHCQDGVRKHSVFLKSKYDYRDAIGQLARIRQRYWNG